MKCPTDEELLRFTLREQSVNESHALERHRVTCALCRATLQEQALLLDDLAATPLLASSEDAFIARVLEGRERPLASNTARRPHFERATWLASLVAAAALCVWVPRLVRTEHVDGGRHAAEQMRARGMGVATDAPFAELLRVRDGVFTPLAGQSLRAGDGLAVRCSNRGDQPTRLMVFALDASDTLHWLFPAYLDLATNPASITIAAHTRDRLLDEVIEPAAPAFGALRVFALFSRDVLTVAQIEAHRHELTGQTLPAFLENARVQRWSTTWNER